GCGFSNFGYSNFYGQPTVIVNGGGGVPTQSNGLRGVRRPGPRIGPSPHTKFRTAGNHLAPPPNTRMAVAHFVPSGVRINRTSFHGFQDRVPIERSSLRGAPSVMRTGGVSTGRAVASYAAGPSRSSGGVSGVGAVHTSGGASGGAASAGAHAVASGGGGRVVH